MRSHSLFYPKSLLRHFLMSLRSLPVWFVIIAIFLLASFMYRYHNELTYFETGENLEDYSKIYAAPYALQQEVTHNACKWPIVNPIEEEIKPFVNYHRSIHCDSEMPNLVSLMEDGRLIVSREMEPIKRRNVPEKFSCVATLLYGSLYPNTENYEMGMEMEISLNTPTHIPYDQFIVRCFNQSIYAFVNGRGRENGSIIYEKAFVNFAGKYPELSTSTRSDEIQKVGDYAEADPLSPSLAILVIDSTSFNQFRRHLPESAQFMEEKGFISMQMYNKMADNSAVNLLPVLAGRPVQTNGTNTDPEDNFVDLNDVNFLWDIMKERGCVTMMNDDIMDPTRGLFHYPNKTFQGFSQQPTDFYLRPYHVFNQKHRVTPRGNGQCMKDGEPSSSEYLSVFSRFSIHFKSLCHFSFNFLTSISHDDPSYVGAIDKQLRVSLERLFANGVSENTVMVVMGDHGNRIHPLKTTFSGRIEERNPLFSIRFPDKWRRHNRDKYHKLRINSNRLVSNFDIHKLLRDVALGDQRDRNTPSFGISLLREEVSQGRSCSDAGIPYNFCLCMDYKQMKSEQYDNSTSLYNEVVYRFSSEMFALPCVVSTEIHNVFEHLYIYSLNQMVLHGLRDLRGWNLVKNTTINADYEFIEIGMRGFTKTRKDGREFGFAAVQRYKYQLSTNQLSTVAPARIIERSLICAAPSIATVCEMCYDDNLLSSPNDIID